MLLLNPKNVDVADLVSVLRDISGHLDELHEYLDRIDDRLDELDAGVDMARGQVGALISTEPGHDRGVMHAVQATLDDLADRHSLIPVTADDDEYEEHCAGCVLKKNGYPRLAGVFSDMTHDHDGGDPA